MPFSQERIIYHREIDQMGYKSKDGKETRVFDALEWLAALCSHLPGKGEQMANAPPIDAFPTYNEQPGPRVRIITSEALITLPKPTFKKKLEQKDRLHISKTLCVQWIWS